MNELEHMLSSGSYVYYKSLQNSKLLSNIYSIGSQRVQNISSTLNNIQSPNNSTQYENFQIFISKYITTIKNIANTLRQNEILYIEQMANKSVGLLSDENIRRLRQLNTKAGLRDSDYQELIACLNKVQYGDQITHLENIMKEQIYNIETLQTNLNELRKINPEKYTQLKSDYLNKYGKYVQEYIGVVRAAIKERFKWKKVTKVQQMAKTINTVLDTLAANPEIESIIKEIWEKHPKETSITITSKDGSAFNAIVDIVVDRVLNAQKGSGATRIAASIIEDIKNRTLILPSIEQQQAFKVMTKRDDEKKSLEEILYSSNKSILNILSNATNAREMLEAFFPDDPKKVKNILSKLKKLEQAVKDVPSNKVNNAIKHFKLHPDDAVTFEESLISELKNTTHYNKVSAALDKKLKLTSEKSKKEYNLVFQQRIRTEMQQSFAIKIDKSGLAELISEHTPEIKGAIISGVSGNSINLKDDVWCAFRLNNTESIVEDSLNEDTELNDLLNQVDSIIKESFSTYIEDYSKATETKKRGQTDVARANELYIEKLEPIINLYKQIEQESPDLFSRLKEYTKENGHFLESISVKEYDLYDNEIGFHAGTLGPTSTHILNNIYNMYKEGGITPLDVKLLDFALLNCSSAAVGGTPLRTSLEMYLLGGAALMVFDEGMGNAQAYLKNMETDIQQLLPKNLNLYFLNQVYIPASYILESIAQNLEQFYTHELAEQDAIMQFRNRVIISDVPQVHIQDNNIINEFEKTANIVRESTTIQFVFMSGMLEIFKNLQTAFKNS